MNIPEHRKAIDKLDEQIVHLLNQRTRHVLEIGSIKVKAGESIYAPHRERMVLQRVAKLNQGPITNESLRAIYREVMSSALSLEKSMTIAYLGPEATFTHQAAIQKFGASLRYAAQKTIADVFSDVSKNRADYGVVPVENSTEGVVSHTLDMFVESNLQIVAQIVLPIQYCLAVNEGYQEAQRLYVHPQALAQCRLWVQRNLPKAEILETSSNARSAELVAGARRDGDAELAARSVAITGVPGRREASFENRRARHPGFQRQRDAFPRVGAPGQPAERTRPHEPDVQHRRPGGRPLPHAGALPQIQVEHDAD